MNHPTDKYLLKNDRLSIGMESDTLLKDSSGGYSLGKKPLDDKNHLVEIFIFSYFYA
jgi:hypothetical protein